ncbi:MAG: hypothetical protein ABH834_07120 [Candidatus Altiarchaeota archaeon]
MTKTIRRDIQYQPSPILEDMHRRMGEIFVKEISEAGLPAAIIRTGEYEKTVMSTSMAAFYSALEARQDIGAQLITFSEALRAGDMSRDLVTGAKTSNAMGDLLAVMPEPVSDLLSSYTDGYMGEGAGRAPTGRVSSTLDSVCILAFAANSLDSAIMDFHPANPEASLLAREVRDLGELSSKVVIIGGPPAAGRDSLVDNFLKMHVGSTTDLPVARRTLFRLAARTKGIYRAVKLTGRKRREEMGEVDGVDYHFFDGGDLLRTEAGGVVADSMVGSMRDGTRPGEEELSRLSECRNNPLAYSYSFDQHQYAFAALNIDTETTSKPWAIRGLKDMLENPKTKMLILGSGTMPELMYLSRLLPNATIAYVAPAGLGSHIADHVDEVKSRMFARELDRLHKIAEMTGHRAWPQNMTGYTTQLNKHANDQLLGIAPQMALALICHEHVPGFNVVPNPGGIERPAESVERLNEVLLKSGKFPGVYKQ